MFFNLNNYGGGYTDKKKQLKKSYSCKSDLRGCPSLSKINSEHGFVVSDDGNTRKINFNY